jgi:methylglutaconyl-CoA hydratase
VGTMLAHIYSSGPKAIVAVKALIPAVANRPIDDALVVETSKRIAAIRATPEAQEGLSAFLEKRAPRWTAPAEKQKASKVKPTAKRTSRRKR